MAECPICRRGFEPRGRESDGSPQRFCGRVCREAFDSALHRWALGEAAAGRVTMETLRGLLPGSINAAYGGERPSGATEMPAEEGAPVAPPLAFPPAPP
jgi:hypothetical protein